MWKEIDDSGQYNLDTRLSATRSLEENTATMIAFAYDLLLNQDGLTRVKNCHEGYGILAEEACKVNADIKTMQNGMKDLLACLPDDGAAIENVESIAGALGDTIVAALQMAAQARRISKDLYKFQDSRTPIEKALDPDGFEEPEKE